MAPKARASSSRSSRAADTYSDTDPRHYGIVLLNNDDNLCSMEHRPTRYFCDHAMESLGTKNDMEN